MIKSFIQRCKKLIIIGAFAQIVMWVILYFDVIFTLLFFCIVAIMFFYLSYCCKQWFLEKRRREKPLYSRGVFFVKPVQHSFYIYRIRQTPSADCYFDNLVNPPQTPVSTLRFKGKMTYFGEGRRLDIKPHSRWSVKSRIATTYRISSSLVRFGT